MQRTHGIQTPEVETQFSVGSSSIYVMEVTEDYDGRTLVLGHDDEGNEVEVRFHPVNDE